MRAYLWTTGLIFALIVVAHVWRVVAESRSLARDPVFLLLTLLAALLVVWAGILLRRTARTKQPVA
jgi:membrane protein DedA with SNARE-associated domain